MGFPFPHFYFNLCDHGDVNRTHRALNAKKNALFGDTCLNPLSNFLLDL